MFAYSNLVANRLRLQTSLALNNPNVCRTGVCLELISPTLGPEQKQIASLISTLVSLFLCHMQSRERQFIYLRELTLLGIKPKTTARNGCKTSSTEASPSEHRAAFREMENIPSKEL